MYDTSQNQFSQTIHVPEPALSNHDCHFISPQLILPPLTNKKPILDQ